MTIRTRRARRHSRRAAAAVEFALTAPLLLLFTFAALEFGRAHMIQNSVNNAVYEAARRAVVPGARPRHVREGATRILAAVGVEDPRVRVLDDGTDVTVDVDVDFNRHSWFSPLFFRDLTISGTITLSKEEPAS